MGRVDNQVKLRGFRIELGEIERLLAGYGAIGETAAAVKEKGGNACLVAYYVAPHELDAADLRQWLSEKLPDYMVPAYYMRLDRLPLTLNGKLDRKALPEPNLGEGAAHVPPATETEAALARIWAEVLGLEPAEISTDKSFFELGGHSLNAPILLAGIAQELNVSFHLQTLVQFQTVSALAGHISRSLSVQLVD
jgi:acyl carrier protein